MIDGIRVITRDYRRHCANYIFSCTLEAKKKKKKSANIIFFWTSGSKKSFWLMLIYTFWSRSLDRFLFVAFFFSKVLCKLLTRLIRSEELPGPHRAHLQSYPSGVGVCLRPWMYGTWGKGSLLVWQCWTGSHNKHRNRKQEKWAEIVRDPSASWLKLDKNK